MPFIQYVEKTFRAETEKIISTANDIIREYQQQGFSLTLRQLYYQFVSRDIIPNNEHSYDRLGSIINDARLAGRIDWEAIEDRTRWLRTNPHWTSPSQILRACAAQFAVDMWENQKVRCEVWIEKDALIGVIERACKELDVPYFACRGYVSQSEQWRAGLRYKEYMENGQEVVVFHLGDHDPSGIDMTRDNTTRLKMFAESMGIDLRRLALNMDQVQQYNPPPNPTKVTDSRSPDYIMNFGHECWELDALEPRVIEALIRRNIESLIEPEPWDEQKQRRDEGRELLQRLADENE